MNLLARCSLIVVLGLCIVGAISCGGGDSEASDESAIQGVFGDFFKAFEDQDVDKLASLLSDDCDDPEQRAADAIDSYVEAAGGAEATYEVTDVEFRDLTETTASARPVGVIRADDGSEFPLGEEDAEYASLVRTDGEWKLTDCNILF